MPNPAEIPEGDADPAAISTTRDGASWPVRTGGQVSESPVRRVPGGTQRRLAGSSAIFQSSPLERGWRDVPPAAQHRLVHDGRWETAGRVLMGLEPGSPLL